MSLPNGVQELQWVKANGNVYLNTTFNPNQNTRVVADVEWDASATTSWLFGARNGKNRDAFAFLTYKSAYRADYGSATTTLSVLPSGRFTVEMDKNVVKINGETVATASSQNFTTNYPIVLFANNTAGTISGYTTAKLYSLKIYDNSTLVRDYIPVRSTSGSTAGLIALYDTVHNIVHGPSGSGDFEAGPEKIEDQAHKALIDGTARDVTSGTCLVGGTAYAIKKGRTLIDGTGYDIPFSSGIPIGTLPVGSVVKIGVNGKLYDFLVVNHGIPSNSSLYDSSCDGTWLLMNDIYENRVWQSGNINKYESSEIHAYLNSTFLNMFDSNIKNAIKQVKIPYRKNGGSGGADQSGANGLSAKIFLLSGYEVGWTTSNSAYFPKDGAKLSYFVSGTGTYADKKRIAKLNGKNAFWWIRSPATNDTYLAWRITSSGSKDYNGTALSHGIRPAFILPSTFPVIQNPDGSYSPAT